MECFCTRSRAITCKIILLDEQELSHEIQDTTNGQALLDVVTKHLNLIETAYFGLRYLDSDNQTHWLDPSKKLAKQLKSASHATGIVTLYFGVKFYAADPCKLLEEITRYQFFLQVKQDILQGRLPVSFELAAELGAYVVQSELGDYDSRRHLPTYVSEFRLLANQSIELEAKISDLHKALVGQLPSVAELNYLDKVKWLDMYGVDLHPVLGEDNVEYFLGLTPSGIIVLRNKNTVGNYYWPRISKIYFKGRYFMLRVTDKNNDESTYGFETPSKAACKHLWKCCIEHHAFFRLVQVTSPTSPDIFALSSRFRYSGRTEKQAVRDAQIKVRTPPSFIRVSSRRYQRRLKDDGTTEIVPAQEPMKPPADSVYQPELKYVSVPQPAHLSEAPVKGTAVPAAYTSSLFAPKAPDSPRSTRSAPWTQPHSRGLYNTSLPPSPRSVRSAGPRYHRSSSVDSQSSGESRTCKRRKHQSRITSDNESELSKSSSRSHRKHRRHRSRNRRTAAGDSGSEADGQHTSHRRRTQQANRGRGRADSHYELIDSESQWRAVQRKQHQQNGVQASSSIQRANVVRNRRNGEGCVSVAMPTAGSESDQSANAMAGAQSVRTRKSRSTKTSSDGNKWLTDELRKHLEFKLVDTTGMSDSQLKEIPYTVVQTNQAKQLKIKQSDRNESPPPPYSPHGMESRNKSNKPTLFNNKLEQVDQQTLINGAPAGFASSMGALLPRVDQLSIDNAMTSGQSVVKTKSAAGSTTLYSSPSTLLAYNAATGNNLLYHNENGLPRIHHEHSDSGLGGEQDTYHQIDRSAKQNPLSAGDHRRSLGYSATPPVPSPTGDAAATPSNGVPSPKGASAAALGVPQVKRDAAEMSTEL